MTRKRLDASLVDRGLFTSRERAHAAVLAGEIKVDGEVVTKAGAPVSDDAIIDVLERPRFVSRGGEKIAGAMETFKVPVEGRRAVDVGASTGGFTDYLLRNGAKSVCAVDVGYGQLAWSLRSDERVTVFERTNIRYADPEALGAPFDIVVVDVSFISLRTIMPALVGLMAEDADVVCLVKPQFEAGKGRVGKKGVVRDASVHAEVLDGAAASAAEYGLIVRGMTFSPVTGPEGNIEFWLWASRAGRPASVTAVEVVEAAHQALGG